jgi:predicted amidohydrolase YtcJ
MTTVHADIILNKGQIYSLDGKGSIVSSLAVKNGRILALGHDDMVKELKGRNTEIIDLEGKWLFPGFIESHGHILWIGEMRSQVDVGNMDDIHKVGEVIAEQAAGLVEGQWIRGHSWNQNQWGEDAFPDHRVLTQAAPNNPTLLTRRDGHSCWVNQRALELAGIDANTSDPPGGKIVRDVNGNPTGILIDRAMAVVESCIPEPSEEETRRLFEIGRDECLRYGVTTFHEAWADAKMIALFRKLDGEEALGFRLYNMLDAVDEDLLRECYERGPLIAKGGHLAIRAIKLFVDGALGSRGALLFEDYKIDPGNRGIQLLDEDDVFEHAMKAFEHGFQVCTHAIGDRASRIALDGYERALKKLRSDGKVVENHRFRVEHAELLSKEDIPRFAELGVIASMQATHCTSDMAWIENHLGSARARERTSLWRSLLDSGAVIAGGSDTPIESTNPLYGIYAAITRMNPHGFPAGGWVAEQRMTREEALRSYTASAAYAAFEEDEKGSLEVGKLADLVVLSKDILEIPPEELLTTDVLLTMVGGKVVYRK